MSHARLSLGIGGELAGDMAVHHFVVHERISRPFSVTVWARSRNPSVEMSSIVGMPAGLDLDIGHPFAFAGQQRWSGICRAMDLEKAESHGVSTYRLELVPQLWLLTQNTDYRIFRHASVQHIATQILGEHGIVAAWALGPGTHPKLDYRVQYGESDFDFISRLLEEAGIAYVFVGTPLGSMLTFSDLWHVQPPRMAPPLGFVGVTHPRDRQREEYIANVRLAHDVRPGSHALSDFDLTRPAFDLQALATRLPILTAPGSLLPSGETRCEHFDYRPGASLIEHGERVEMGVPLEGAGAVPDAQEEASPQGARAGHGGDARHDVAFAHLRAHRTLAALRAGREELGYTTNALDLRPGCVFMMRHPHPELVGRLLVTELTIRCRSLLEGTQPHGTQPEGAQPEGTQPEGTQPEGTQPEGTQPEGTAEAWSIAGRAVLGDKPYHPPLLTPRPRARGMQSATVVATANEDIHTDGYGRVRVQFPWDRRGRSDPASSCWVRVNQGWGGAGYGMQHIPRVGQEVLVSFLDGDPEQPVVMGREHNATQPVPYRLPAHDTISTWRSATTIGHDGFNELELEDKAGDELVYLQAQKDLEQLVKNDEVTTVCRDRDKTVSRHESDTTDGDRTEVTGRHRSQAVGGGFVTTVGETRRERLDQDDQNRIDAHHQLLAMSDQDIFVRRKRREAVAEEAHFISGARSQKIRRKQSLIVTDDQHEKVTGNHALHALGEVFLHANVKIVAEATNDVTIKGPGGGFLRIDREGITIYGARVEINVGGDPGRGTPCSVEAPEEPETIPAIDNPAAPLAEENARREEEQQEQPQRPEEPADAEGDASPT